MYTHIPMRSLAAPHMDKSVHLLLDTGFLHICMMLLAKLQSASSALSIQTMMPCSHREPKYSIHQC